MNQTENILAEINFAFFPPYKIAAMAEPWAIKFDRTMALLKKQGVGAILTLTEDDPYGERYISAGFKHHHEPIDDCEPPSAEGMNRAISFLESCVSQNVTVALHCLEGRGRTGTVLAAWVGLKESLDADAAVEKVYKTRTHTVITPSQRVFLKNYLNDRDKSNKV